MVVTGTYLSKIRLDGLMRKGLYQNAMRIQNKKFETNVK